MTDLPSDGSEHAEEQPLCMQCLSPVDPLEYYCPKCGFATGQLTPHIPFVNIQHYTNFMGRMWRKIWFERASPATKLLCFFMIVLSAPFLLLGLPFVAWRWLRNVRNG